MKNLFGSDVTHGHYDEEKGRIIPDQYKESEPFLSLPRWPKLYLTGSLRNPNVPEVANYLRSQGFEVFDDWYAAGEKADDEWMKYEKQRGHTFKEALKGHAANHVFEYDLHHISEADALVMVGPAGKSSFLELGFAIGTGKKAYVYYPFEPERWDVMVKFAHGVDDKLEDLEARVRKDFGV